MKDNEEKVVDDFVSNENHGKHVANVVDEVVSEDATGDVIEHDTTVTESVVDTDSNGSTVVTETTDTVVEEVVDADSDTDVDPDVVDDDEDILDRDDESFLRGDDSVIYSDDEMAMLQQLDGVLAWRIEGLYNDDGEVLKPWELKKNPPQLIIERQSPDAEEAESVSIDISENMAQVAEESFYLVNSGYRGVEPDLHEGTKSQRTHKEPVSKRFVTWVSENKVKAVFGLIVILLIIFAIIFG